MTEMKKSEFLQKIQPHLEQTDLKKICLFISNYLGKNDDLTLLLRRCNNIDEDFDKKKISKEYYDIEQRRILISLQNILEDLSENSIVANPFEDEIQEDKITIKEKTEWANEFLRQYTHRIAHKIKKHFEIEMELLPDYTGTDTHFAKNHFAHLTKEDKNKAYHELAPIFERYDKRVLLIGEPGSGKTVLLLKFAAEKLQEYIDSPEKKYFPIILNLASWRSEMQHFSVWLEKVLRQSGFSSVTATHLVKYQPFLLLLDGLDEIRSKEDRESCLKALSEYLTHINRNTQTIICSRKAEYKATDANAPVYVSFCVKPLKEKQLKEEIESKKQDGINLLNALKGNKPLLETLQTPFYLATALEVFASPNENAPIFPSKEEYQAYILAKYVDRQLNSPDMFYEKEKIEKYLQFLARNMRERGLLRIEMVDLQPDWLARSWFMNLIVFVSINLFYFIPLFIYLLFKQSDIAVGFHIFGLVLLSVSDLFFIVCLFLILISAIIKGIGKQLINPKEVIKFSLKTWLIETIKNILDSIYEGFALGFIFGLILGLIFGFDIALLPCLFLGFLFGLIKGIVDDLPTNAVECEGLMILKSSYSRFYREILWQILQSIMVWIILNSLPSLGVYGLILLIMQSNYDVGYDYIFIDKTILFYSILYSILYSIILGAWVGIANTSILKHFTLRFCLYIEDSLPLQVDKFFDTMATKEIALMEKDGGTWRFRHELLQDYFCR